MKIIDENGRLFGKINIIDFLVLLLLVSFIPVVYHGYRIFNKKTEISEKHLMLMPIDVYVIFKNLDPKLAESILVGDIEQDINGRTMAEIINIYSVENNFIEFKLSNESMVTKEDSLRRQITAKLSLLVTLDGRDVIYKEKPVKVDAVIGFKTPKYEIKGVIIPEPSHATQLFESGFNYMTLDIIFENLNPEVANLISIGDFEIDKEGDTIAKILSIESPEPYSRRIDMGDGNYIAKIDPNKRQLKVKMRIRGAIDRNGFYFMGKRIALDSRIEFNTNKYQVKGMVIKEPVLATRKSLEIPVNLDIIFENLNPEVANLISIGDFEIDKEGDTIAKILSIGSPEPYSCRIDMGDGNYMDKIDTNKRQLKVKMEVRGAMEGDRFYFMGKRIALDSRIEFNTNKYQVKGVVIADPTIVVKVNKRWVLLKVRINNLNPEVVNNIKVGDKVIDGVSGDTIVKLDSVVSVTPSNIFNFNLGEKRELVVAADPSAKDVILELRVFCVKNQQGFVFKEKTIKINKDFFMETDKYEINGKIIEIQEIKGDGKE